MLLQGRGSRGRVGAEIVIAAFSHRQSEIHNVVRAAAGIGLKERPVRGIDGLGGRDGSPEHNQNRRAGDRVQTAEDAGAPNHGTTTVSPAFSSTVRTFLDLPICSS